MTTLQARWKVVVLAVVALAAVAVILALTAFNSSDSGSDPAASDTEQAMLAFAQCMRDNGVPSFPDPVARSDGSFGFERPSGVEPSALDDALESCQSEARAAGVESSALRDPEAQDTLLEFSGCMRANGVPEFPDPKPGGNGSLRGVFGDVDLQSPRVQKAMEGCDSILSRLGSPFGGGGG